MKIVKLSLLLMGTAFICSTALAQQPLKLSGITVEDKYPNGCVDCHAQIGDNDYRLNVRMKKYIPNHPDISKKTVTIPKSCKMCHRKGKEGGPLSLISHKAHYHKPPAENDFIKYYKGDCLSCHQLNLSTGQITIKSGPKNW